MAGDRAKMRVSGGPARPNIGDYCRAQRFVMTTDAESNPVRPDQAFRVIGMVIFVSSILLQGCTYQRSQRLAARYPDSNFSATKSEHAESEHFQATELAPGIEPNVEITRAEKEREVRVEHSQAERKEGERRPASAMPSLPAAPPADTGVPVTAASSEPVAAAAKPETTGETVIERPHSGVRDFPIVKIYFATDRKWTGKQQQPKWFSHEWNDANEHLTFGTCLVSIPESHTPGVVDKPSLWHFRLSENPRKDVIVRLPKRLEKSAFFKAMGSQIRRWKQKEIVVFIHGFNNTFDDAASRLGVLAYDMDFNGVPVLYSWCSEGGPFGWSPTAYVHDEDIITSTVRPLANFLADVARVGREAGIQRVSVVAHSLGNRALVGALQVLAQNEKSSLILDEVVMAAPDVRQTGFATDEWPRMHDPAKRLTLYASSDDKALIASKKAHEFPRLGEAGNALLLISGLDTVDASGCDFSLFGLNHSYFGGGKVLSDLRTLIEKGLPPLERKLREKRRKELSYWLLPALETNE